jgi:CheY-like chemotaxis protein
MEGDSEKCLEGGMDDDITKPIKREIVLAARKIDLTRMRHLKPTA